MFKNLLQRTQSYKNLKQRLLVAVVGIPLVIAAITFSQWTYFLFFLALSQLTLREFYGLVRQKGLNPSSFWGTWVTGYGYCLAFSFKIGWSSYSALYLACLLLPVTGVLQLYKKEHENVFINFGYTLLGILYVGLPFIMLHDLAFVQGIYTHELVLSLLLLVWANDTGAYFIGKRFGKRKLFSRVSPKKTWWGAIGGGITTVITAYLLSQYFPLLPPSRALILAPVVAIAGTYGDLLASLFKRDLGVKDSSSALLGHGGFIDRFDGLLFAIPVVHCLLHLLP